KKKVLDLGSGESSLAAEIENKEKGNKVTSVDMNELLLKATHGTRVAANAEFLPFKSNEFDTVFATWSLPYWANSPKQVDRSFREIRRVTKPGGNILYTPITGINARAAQEKTSVKI